MMNLLVMTRNLLDVTELKLAIEKQYPVENITYTIRLFNIYYVTIKTNDQYEKVSQNISQLSEVKVCMKDQKK